ncbi:hypothetical protein [Kribbella sancticallisti]
MSNYNNDTTSRVRLAIASVAGPSPRWGKPSSYVIDTNRAEACGPAVRVAGGYAEAYGDAALICASALGAICPTRRAVDKIATWIRSDWRKACDVAGMPLDSDPRDVATFLLAQAVISRRTPFVVVTVWAEGVRAHSGMFKDGVITIDCGDAA